MIIVLLNIYNISYSQSSKPNRLCLTNATKHKTRYFKEGRRIKFRLKGHKEIIRGKLVAIRDSSIVINDVNYKVSEFSMISSRPTGMTVARIAGGTMVLGGAYFIGSGAFLISNIYVTHDSNEKMNNVFYFIIGTFAIVGGGVMTTVGVVPMIISMKKYNLEKDWTMKIVQ